MTDKQKQFVRNMMESEDMYAYPHESMGVMPRVVRQINALLLFGPKHMQQMKVSENIVDGQGGLIVLDDRSPTFDPTDVRQYANPVEYLRHNMGGRHMYRYADTISNDLGEEQIILVHDSTCCEQETNTEPKQSVLYNEPGRLRFKDDRYPL